MLSTLDLVLVAVGTLGVIMAALSARIRRLPVSEPLLALTAGVLLGPEVLDTLVLEPLMSDQAVIHEASRILLAISVMGVALRYPFGAVREQWRGVTLLLVIAMPAMALISTGLSMVILMTKLPPAPTYFQKPTTAINSHGGDVVRPERCKYLNFEGEIAIVIGETARNVDRDDAGSVIAGYTIANDYGLHDFRDTDAGSMLRVKGSDTLCPIGPGLVTDWDFNSKEIRTLVNGSVVQEGNTSEMEWDMHYLVADLARTITLLPGDVILSGTPAGSRPVEPGDVVTVEVEGLGALSNKIVTGPVPIGEGVGAQPSESEEVLSTALGGDWEFRGVRSPRGPGAKHYESELEE